MYAIIETGGKQYRVEQGSKLRVETLPYKKGEEFNLERVLLLQGDAGLKFGKPIVDGAKVTAQVLAHDRAKKIIVFKKRSKKTYKKTQGHRQNYTEIVIKSISAAA
jgi:large subunit ribosomal protein L21